MSEPDNGFDETAECKRCHRDRIIMRRGLCSDCILEEVEAGTLDTNYPRGSEPEGEQIERQPVKEQPEEEAMTRGAKEGKKGEQRKSTRACLKCGEVKVIIGRGLCSKCYLEERRAGTLDQNYPKAPKPGSGRIVKIRTPKAAKKAAPEKMGPQAAPEVTPRPRAVHVEGPWKQQAEDALHPGRRLLLAALDALGEVAEGYETEKNQARARDVYSMIGRLEREARLANVL